jgi:hypothetical protein
LVAACARGRDWPLGSGSCSECVRV